MTGTSQGLFIDKYTVVYMYTQNKQKGIKSKQFEQAQEDESQFPYQHKQMTWCLILFIYSTFPQSTVFIKCMEHNQNVGPTKEKRLKHK